MKERRKKEEKADRKVRQEGVDKESKDTGRRLGQ